MPWIKMVDENEANGELAEMYAQERSAWGVDHIFKIHSLNPPSLKAHSLLYRTLMYGRSGLTRTQREMIAVVVSAINRCHY
jgi:uncharacterized peroxidase-related enzyme